MYYSMAYVRFNSKKGEVKGVVNMDWVAEAIRLKEDMTWDDVAEEIYNITGEQYSTEKVRAACRRRIAKLEESSEREGFDEKLPTIIEKDNIYTIYSAQSIREPVKLHKNKLRILKRMYCTKPFPTMNECARKLDIPREDFYLILKAFRITHTDVPFIDEDLVEREIEDLAWESLQHRKYQYEIAYEKAETRQDRKDAEKWRKQEYFLQTAHEAVMEHMKDFNKKYKGPTKISPIVEEGFLLEVPVVDLHLGKLAWSPETGENYDYKIARQRYHRVIDDVVARAQGRPIEKILMPISNDFFHFDTISQTTTAGTPQDSDMRWPKLYGVGVEMLVISIDQFRGIAPVEVILIPGNHDRMTGYYAITYLYAWYRNNEDVNVQVDPKTRKYFEHGASLIGFGHGDKEKGRIWGLMSIEAPKAWGRSKYREWHLAHEHSESSKEGSGIILRRLSSVTGTDIWHYDQGYIGAVPKQQTFLWDREKGLYEIWQTVI